jgi:hypothetical protein
MPLPSLYVSPEDRIDSNEMAKQLAEEIKQFQSEQQNVGGGGGSAGAAQAVQVEIDAPEADKVDGEDSASSIALLDAIREATQTTANFVKGMASQVHSMHFDALKQRKNADNHALLQKIADNTQTTAERVPPPQDESDAEKEDEESSVPGAPGEDQNDKAQENNKAVKSPAGMALSVVGKALGGMVKGIGSLFGKMFSGLKKMFSGMVKAFAKFAKFFMIGIAALALAALMVTKQGIELFRGMREMFDNLVAMLAPVVEILMEVFSVVMEVFLKIANTIMPIVTNFLTTILPTIKSVLTILGDMLMMLVDFIAPMVETIVNTILPALMPVIELIMVVLKGILDTLLNVLKPIFAVLMIVFQALANVFGFIASIAMAVIALFTEGPAVAFDMLKNAGDFIIAGIGDLINGIIEFLASIVDAVPGPNFGLADKIRGMKVEFGDKARARIEKRGQDRDGTTAQKLVEEGTIDMSLPMNEFQEQIDAKVEDGSISSVTGQKLLEMKTQADVEAEAAKGATDATGPDSADAIIAAVVDSMAQQNEDTVSMATKFEATQEQMNQGRGLVADTSDFVDTIPTVPASVVNAGSTDAKESEKESQSSGQGDSNVQTSVVNNVTTAKNETTTTFGMSGNGSDSLGHRHRRVLPGVA